MAANPQVFFEVEINKENAGIIVFEVCLLNIEHDSKFNFLKAFYGCCPNNSREF